MTINIKTEPWWRAIAVVQNPRENITSGPQTCTALPHQLHFLVLETIVSIVVVNTGKEKSIHAKLSGGKRCRVICGYAT